MDTCASSVKKMPRKIYIATAKDDATKDRVFGHLRDKFNVTESAADAEFIVLDCDQPAEPNVWVGEKAWLVVPERCYPPIVLATDGRSHPDFFKELARAYKGNVSELHLCEGPGKLLETLNKLEAALPFYNANNTSDPAKAYELAIFILKTFPPALRG
jgi:hypothetical protein